MNDVPSTSDASSPPDRLPNSSDARESTPPWAAWIMAGALVLAALWSFWPTLGLLAQRWSIDPQYSHGFLVPIFAALILWVKKPTDLTWRPNPWGVAVMVVSMLPRWFSARMDLAYVDGACLVGSLLGLALLMGGKVVLRWAAPSILFLGFM